MGRFLYEHSVSYRGYLIIPFVFTILNGEVVYSYRLLSDLGHRGAFHQAENPAGLHSESLEGIITIAQEHLRPEPELPQRWDSFRFRYTYRHHLIVVYQQTGQYYYDHYLPQELYNIAAPRLFPSEYECLIWVKQGIDRLQPAEIGDRGSL